MSSVTDELIAWSFAFAFGVRVALIIIPLDRWRSCYGYNFDYHDRRGCCTGREKVCAFIASRSSMSVSLTIGRSSAFFYRFTSDLIAECVVPPIASILMKRNLWTLLIAAVEFMAFGTLMMLTVPETLPIEVQSLVDIVSNVSHSESGIPNGEAEQPSDDPKPRWKVENWINASKQFFDFITRDKLVTVLLLAFLALRVGRQAYRMFLQYVSKRYGWTIAQVCSPYAHYHKS